MHEHNEIALGFDFGLKRIGVAVGQTLTCSATPLDTLYAKNGVPEWNQIQKLIKEWQPTLLIVCIPLNMDDTEQAITHAAKQFAKELNTRFNLPISEVDERLSTKEARQQIFDAGGYKALKETPIDSIAAVIILEQWLRTHDHR